MEDDDLSILCDYQRERQSHCSKKQREDESGKRKYQGAEEKCAKKINAKLGTLRAKLIDKWRSDKSSYDKSGYSCNKTRRVFVTTIITANT